MITPGDIMEQLTCILDSNQTCFYYPTKVVFLDDNSDFLSSVALNFTEQKNMLMFTNPNEAMRTINQNTAVNDLWQLFTDSNEHEERDNTHYTDGLKISNMTNFIYDPARFNHIAVVVVDYEMPHINGVEFCQQLQGKPIFKILLTGEADKDTAIDAFNRGIIDKFISKASPHLYQELERAINDLTNKYFKNISETILKHCGDSLHALLNNKQYKALFKKVIAERQAVEYYLVDRQGSFLFLTKQAKPTWLVVCDHKKIDEQVSLLKGYDFSKILTQCIANKNNLLFLFSENEYKEPLKSWEKYIFRAKKLNETYSYSIVEGNLTNSIQWEKVTPYEQ